MTYDLLTQIVKEQTALDKEVSVTSNLKFPCGNGAYLKKEF